MKRRGQGNGPSSDVRAAGTEEHIQQLDQDIELYRAVLVVLANLPSGSIVGNAFESDEVDA